MADGQDPHVLVTVCQHVVDFGGVSDHQEQVWVVVKEVRHTRIGWAGRTRTGAVCAHCWRGAGGMGWGSWPPANMTQRC